MASVRPFTAVRPAAGLEDKIAALPYDVYNRKEACEAVKNKEMSFLRIDRAETLFPDDIDIYDSRVYKKAHDLYEEFKEKKYYIKDKKDCYYIYALTMNGRTQTGLVINASIDDYINNIIKKHENTRAEKERDRINHVDALSAQTGPIFLAYKKNDIISDIIKKNKKKSPYCDFISEDGIRHQAWIIDADKDIENITKEFEKVSSLYIADGHHRAASAVKVGLKRRKEHPDYSGHEEFNRFLSILFEDDELMIMDYNRVVKDLYGYSKESFLSELAKTFDIEEKKEVYKPVKKGEMGMCLMGEWYKIRAKAAIFSTDPVAGLDVSILHDNVLDPILGIKNPKTDERIDFIGGIRGLKELERRVKEDCTLAFAMYPTGIDELFNVADQNKLMPPKSTWFEPKLRSGLFIHEFER